MKTFQSNLLACTTLLIFAMAITSCDDDDKKSSKVTVEDIFWYSYDDNVPEGGTSPFDPTDEFTSTYTVTVQNSSQQTTVPTGYDVLVLADNYNAEFSIADFDGQVIVTFDSGLNGVMRDFFGGSDDNDYQKDTYWTYGTSSTLTWVEPALDAEDCTSNDAVVFLDSLVNDYSWVTRRNDLIEAKSSDGDTDANDNSDAVIIYEFGDDSDSNIKYWIQIGPLDSDYSTRACEVLVTALNTIAK